MAMTLRPHWLGTIRRMAAVTGLALLVALPVLADESMTVTVHKAKLLRLQRAADLVMIANPTIADVVVESPTMIFILGIEPGETSLHILDERGNEILHSAIVVVPTPERTVTVNRASNLEEATYSCTPRCAAVGTAVGTGSAPPTGSGDDDSSDDSSEPAASAATETDTGTAETAAGDGGDG